MLKFWSALNATSSQCQKCIGFGQSKHRSRVKSEACLSCSLESKCQSCYTTTREHSRTKYSYGSLKISKWTSKTEFTYDNERTPIYRWKEAKRNWEKVKDPFAPYPTIFLLLILFTLRHEFLIYFAFSYGYR